MQRLNVVNGMAMYNYLKENEIDLHGEIVPFNEAMCEGDATEDIFSGDFELIRCSVHGVGMEEYEDIVIHPLAPLFSLDYEELHLFFDEDMFCVINLLTLLAYLDINEYEGDIMLHIIDYNFDEIRAVMVKPQTFYNVYIDVLINKIKPKIALPDIMDKAIDEYFEYSKENNEIDKFILENLYMSEDELLDKLFDKFRKYGVGDIQYRKRINILKDSRW